MKIFASSLFILLCSLPSAAQVHTWQPSAAHVQVPLWPSEPPNARPYTGPETTLVTGADSFVAGKPWTYINNVTKPTLTVYPARGVNTGAAVLVFPGGGYQILAIDLEGSEVCDWLTSRGVTCVLVKYRVPGEGKLPKSGGYPKSAEALQDAQRALRLVRARSRELHIDPKRIGVLGFSAGGHIAAAMSVHFRDRLYPRVDAADDQTCRPDFAVALYPGHLSVADNSVELASDMATHITRDTSPTFLLQNEDDHVDRVEDSLSYYMGLKKAGVPVEMHLYATGGHAFGLRRTREAATEWPALVERWMRSIGVLR